MLPTIRSAQRNGEVNDDNNMVKEKRQEEWLGRVVAFKGHAIEFIGARRGPLAILARVVRFLAGGGRLLWIFWWAAVRSSYLCSCQARRRDGLIIIYRRNAS